MSQINQIPGTPPLDTEKRSPFEIVIRTSDPDALANGGPVEQAVPCLGYVLFANLGDPTQMVAQGAVNWRDILTGLAGQVKDKSLFMAAALGALRNDGDAGDAE